MNTYTSNTISTSSLAFAALIALALFVAAPKAQAADLCDGGYSYDYACPNDVGSSYDYAYPNDNGYSYDYAYPNDNGYSYDYAYPNDNGYSYDYAYPISGYSGGFSPGGFSSGGGWSSGGWTSGGWMGGGGMSQSQSLSNTNVNQNYCTNGSCNTAINAPTNIVTTNPAPIIYNTPSYPVYQPVYNPLVYVPQAPVCYTCGCAGYPACARTVYPPAQPYVTLAAVPYTGFELGTTGTILYWGFLVLWCLIAAYLIAVKKIQNKIANWFTTSDASHTTHSVAHTAPAAHVHSTSVQSTHSTQFSGIDPFIQSQINRA